MAWATPPTPGAGSIVTAAQFATIAGDLNFLRNGIVNVVTVTTNQGPTSGTVELTVATSGSVTFDGSTVAEVSFSWYNTSNTVATDGIQIRLYDGSTQIGQFLLAVSSNGSGGTARAVITPTAGAHTFTARLVRGSGTGTSTLSASSTSPAQLLVRQVG